MFFDVAEEVLDAIICEHLFVEGLHSRIDCALATELVIQTAFARSHPLGAAGVLGKGIRLAFIDRGDGWIDQLAADGADFVDLLCMQGGGGDQCCGTGDDQGRYELHEFERLALVEVVVGVR